MTYSVREATLPAGKVAYWDEGTGQTLILLHSLGTSKRLWFQTMQELKAFRSVAPDFLSHGDSDLPPREFTIQDHADTVIALLDHLQIESVTLVGTSMGAVVGIDVAARFPRRVEKLVLNGCPGWHLEEQRIARLRTVAERVDPRTGLPRPGRPGGTVGAATETEIEERAKDLAKAGRFFMSSMWAIAAYDLATRLNQIQCPTQVLMGDADFHMATSYVLQDGIRGSQLVTMSGVGHLSPYDAPELVANHISGFAREAA